VSPREERRALKARTPQTRLSLIHTKNCKVLPDRGELLHELPRRGVAAEIGVAFGDFTEQILERNNPAKLYLIDSWESRRYQEGLARIEQKFATAIAKNSIEIRRGYSTEKLSEFDDNFFDWVYIDTNHSFDTTWKELQLADRKVKKRGQIAGHDFCTGNAIKPVPYGVVEACAKFCREYGWQYAYVTLESHGHFSFCLERL
jgi:hypothetical protein